MNLSDLIAGMPREKSLDALAALFDSLQQVVHYASLGEEEFRQNRAIQDAIMYRLVCAGEATKRFLDAYEGGMKGKGKNRKRARNDDMHKLGITEADLKDLMGLRDKLGHYIDEQDLDIVWEKAVNKIPLMIPPVSEALMNAPLAWFKGGDTPGRVAARKMALAELQDSMQSLMQALTSPAYDAVRQITDALSQESKEVVANALRHLPYTGLGTQFNPAEKAVEAIEANSRYFERVQLIEEWLDREYSVDDLHSFAMSYGPGNPVIEDFYPDEVDLNESTGRWVARYQASADYEAEGTRVMTQGFIGRVSGTITEDDQVEIEEATWQLVEDDDADELNR